MRHCHRYDSGAWIPGLWYLGIRRLGTVSLRIRQIGGVMLIGAWRLGYVIYALPGILWQYLLTDNVVFGGKGRRWWYEWTIEGLVSFRLLKPTQTRHSPLLSSKN
jgi:hypothetical protein